MSSPENPVRFSPRRRVVSVQRSTKAGASTPATPLEVEPIRHLAVVTLNEGRSVNPGDTAPLNESVTSSTKAGASTATRRSTKAGASTPATLKRLVRLAPPEVRSTKAGASTPATRQRLANRRAPSTALNEGRSVNPGDTSSGPGHWRHDRSTKAGASTPATLVVGHQSLNEGRSVNPGDTNCCDLRAPEPCTLNEGRSVNPGDTSTKAGASATRGDPGSTGSLNEGRSVNPGDTRHGVAVSCRVYPLNEGRSVNPGDTRASGTQQLPPPPLNEGRSVNPGDTNEAGPPRSTKAGASTPARGRSAQRRPERQPRRHP